MRLLRGHGSEHGTLKEHIGAGNGSSSAFLTCLKSIRLSGITPRLPMTVPSDKEDVEKDSGFHCLPLLPVKSTVMLMPTALPNRIHGTGLDASAGSR